MPDITVALPRLLPRFLPRQRWFGSKAKPIADCRVDDLAELGTDGVVLVIARLSFGDGTEERYVLLLRRVPDGGTLPIVGELAPPERGSLVECSLDAAGALHLLGGFRAACELPTMRGGRLRYDDIGKAARQWFASPSADVSAVGAEQSNTSLRLGSSLVFKLFRRLQEGENPELEVGRFLTARTTFRDMSALEGSLSYESPGRRVSTLGILQQWVENDGDGWRYVVAALERGGAEGIAAEVTRDMRALGDLTGRFHAALASDPSVDAFRPEPVAPGDVAAWTNQVRERATRVLHLLEHRLTSSGSAETRELAASVAAKAGAAHALASQDRKIGFLKIRIHGDYHLGQTLKTRVGFAVIDFEGEPARPLEERRQKQCALRDVAGMLRSFEYAIDTAWNGRLVQPDRPRLSASLRDAYLDGYLRASGAHGAAWLPPEDTFADWLSLFEFDKALYEVEYEMNNRPAWVNIPLRAILRMLGRA